MYSFEGIKHFIWFSYFYSRFISSSSVHHIYQRKTWTEGKEICSLISSYNFIYFLFFILYYSCCWTYFISLIASLWPSDQWSCYQQLTNGSSINSSTNNMICFVHRKRTKHDEPDRTAHRIMSLILDMIRDLEVATFLQETLSAACNPRMNKRLLRLFLCSSFYLYTWTVRPYLCDLMADKWQFITNKR